jgi:hypothetical protein
VFAPGVSEPAVAARASSSAAAFEGCLSPADRRGGEDDLGETGRPPLVRHRVLRQGARRTAPGNRAGRRLDRKFGGASPVQACRDARRAFRNWFDLLSGKGKGRQVGHPRFRSRKDDRQSIRLTRNGFGVTARGVRVAKVGNIPLEWSRELPSVPSGVTIIREAGTTSRSWWRWQPHRYRQAGTMSGSTSAWHGWPRCPPAR